MNEINSGKTLFNKYRIERILGEGADGQVWLATHLELNALFALKIVRKGEGGVAGSDFTGYEKRFQLEARLGAHLKHAHIVQVYDFERSEDLLVMRMEPCTGGSLQERIDALRAKEEQIPLPEVLQVAQDAAQGLAELHRRQIVHRDLKPGNILIDAKGRAKVADLGLAQAPGGPSLRGRKSEAQPHPGTPGYRSPEQKDTRDFLKPSSDVYALGLVLFEMLTGSMYALQKPGIRAVDLRPDVPNWLDGLVMQMLEKEPQRRPWDAAEVTRLLRDGVNQHGGKHNGQKAYPLHKTGASKKLDHSSLPAITTHRTPELRVPPHLSTVSGLKVQPERSNAGATGKDIKGKPGARQATKKIIPLLLLFLLVSFVSLVLIPWGLFPPSAEGVPSILRSDLKEDWVLLAADTYSFTTDAAWIQDIGLSRDEFTTILNNLVLRNPQNSSLSLLQDVSTSIYPTSRVTGVKYIRTLTHLLFFLVPGLLGVVGLLVRKFLGDSPGCVLFLSILFLAISVGAGLGYWVMPVQIHDLGVSHLSPDYQTMYLKMSVFSYAVNRDEFLATVRWQELGDAAPEILRTIESDSSLPLAIQKFKTLP